MQNTPLRRPHLHTPPTYTPLHSPRHTTVGYDPCVHPLCTNPTYTPLRTTSSWLPWRRLVRSCSCSVYPSGLSGTQWTPWSPQSECAACDRRHTRQTLSPTDCDSAFLDWQARLSPSTNDNRHAFHLQPIISKQLLFLTNHNGYKAPKSHWDTGYWTGLK